MRKIGSVFIFILATATAQVYAQADSCILKLKNAATFFDEGNYDNTIQLLKSALGKCNLDREDKFQAYKLLALSYIRVDNLEEADNTAAAIMKMDPYYKPDKFREDPKVSALFEKYSPSPTFRISLGGGLNFSQTESDHSYSIVHSPGESGLDTYNSKTGFQLGVAAEYRVFHDLWVTAGFQYRRSAYEHILDSVEGTTVNYSEELSYFDVPLAARYYFLKKSFSPWIEGGASLSFLSGAISTTTRSDSKDIVDRSSLRNDFMTGWLVGAGFSYQVKGISLQLSVRYAGYPELVNKEGTRYEDPVNVYKYYYLDDDFRMNLIQVNAGIAYTLTYKYKK